MKKYFLVLLVFGCDNAPKVNSLTVTTKEVTSVSATHAVSGGNVLADGGTSIISRGVVWGKNSNPTYEANAGYTQDSTGTGSFVSAASKLEPNTTYYLRAYASNASAIGYGSEKTFTTTPHPKDLLPTSLNISWEVLETSFNDKFSLILSSACGSFGYPYCSIGFQLHFFIEKSKISTGSTILLSNGAMQISDKTPPSDGSYVLYDYRVDDPPRGGYFYETGSITITSITDGKIFGSFNIIDNFSGYTPKLSQENSKGFLTPLL